MKKLPIALLVLLFATSCGNEETAVEPVGENGELSTLKSENIQLKNQAAKKDSLINSYASYINQIHENLGLITEKQNAVSLKREKGEFSAASSSDDDALEDIREIAELMAKNKQLNRKLQKQLEASRTENSALRMDNTEYEKMIITLTEEVAVKNREIFELQQELENVDAAYSELFDALDEKQDIVDEQEDKLNAVWFTMGSRKELKQNEVITKEGLLGIGKSSKLKADFNREYFTESDKTILNEITMGAKKAELLTTHPTDSYSIENGGEKLVILDTEKFWSVSKYLVVVLD